MDEDFLPKRVWDWLLTCPHVSNLYYGTGEAEDGCTALVPLPDDDEDDVRFIDGSVIKSVNFALKHFQSLSLHPNAEDNLFAANQASRIRDWICEKNRLRAFPLFPDGFHVSGITVTQGSEVNLTNGREAVFIIKFSIEYVCEV